MTASILKQDPNTKKFPKKAYLFYYAHSMQISEEIPFIKPQNDT